MNNGLNDTCVNCETVEDITTDTAVGPAPDMPKFNGSEFSIAKILTYGEKAVGLNFNPGQLNDVKIIKEKYASIIDLLNNKRSELRSESENQLMTPEQRADNGETQRLISVAITEAQTAQMWAVKAVTFNLK